ncbi:MAG TPA: acyltransferase [Syntrophales bacterium]|nr:acyltransferase [Syntrophales bacterium]HRT88289.1 acyltransferase [Anaerohalosphaeraceae bacterium]
MPFKDYYVSHFDKTNQIDAAYGDTSLYYILFIFVLLILVTGKNVRKGNFNGKAAGDHFTHETTTSFRGLAIVFLLLGHLSEKCIEGVTFLDNGGRWAVVVFLFLSGVSLAKTYGLDSLDKRFILNRIRRIAIPYWMTLALFLVLDYFLIGYHYSIKRIILAFCGIMFPWPPIGHAWFITYILFLYGLYYFVSLLQVSKQNKALSLLLLSYLFMLTIVNTRLFNYFALWVIYTAVFPAGVLIGLYRNKIFDFLGGLYGKSRGVYAVILIIMLTWYYRGSSHGWLSQPDNVMRTIHTFQPLILVIFLTMFACFIDSFNYQSSVLMFLGDYSYEIYLLHLPFMEYYDFELFRKPLVEYFFIYFATILLMSYLVRKITKYMNQKILFFRPHLKHS